MTGERERRAFKEERKPTELSREPKKGWLPPTTGHATYNYPIELRTVSQISVLTYAPMSSYYLVLPPVLAMTLKQHRKKEIKEGKNRKKRK